MFLYVNSMLDLKSSDDFIYFMFFVLQNLERRNDVVRKLCDVRAIFSSEAKDIANDSYKDYHISDLEISDDEEVQSGRKPI